MPRKNAKLPSSSAGRRRRTARRPSAEIIALARRTHGDGWQEPVPLLELWARGWAFEDVDRARPNGRTVFDTNFGVLRLKYTWELAVERLQNDAWDDLGVFFWEDCRLEGQVTTDDDAYRRSFYRYAVVDAKIPKNAPPQVHKIIGYHRSAEWHEKEFQHTMLELTARGYFLKFDARSNGVGLTAKFSTETLTSFPEKARAVHARFPLSQWDWDRLVGINWTTCEERGIAPPPWPAWERHPS